MKQGTKYFPLFEYLATTADREEPVELTFEEIEDILQAPLPASAQRSRSWWANARTAGRVQSAAWMEAGYHVDSVDLEREHVTFKRPEREYHLRQEPEEVEWNAHTIRALRRFMDVTQQELADRLNMRQQTISEWETGQYQPRGGSIALLDLVAERAGFYNTSENHQDMT